MRRREFICLAAFSLVASRAQAVGVVMTVHKDPNCGCCGAWASAYEAAGFTVTTRNEDDMDAVKSRLKVPTSIHGCHTATVQGYYLEGHVPLEAAEKLLKERPPIAGLAVAGMPRGSLGMGDDPGASYDVMAVPRDGGQPFVYVEIRPK
ncbi:DUF411 domain-containing protein [Sinorhizobium medicae]|nr:DUF411 domain-containing protein [Sinorhizobium medicae]MDX0533003.1 DUF411 domain-containing protein [Sinorhizobium medicae]MDX0997685.1 DUF411 domain-containing protein [Sinorhizobium medicae]MDX1181538.1 DUF411 domain-containing protein [Sinorhizobium medicae]